MKTTLTDQQRAAIMFLQALLETVRDAGPDGAPAGPMYAACMAANACTLEVFEGAMARLCQAGLIIKRGHVYYYNAVPREPN